MDPVKDIGPHGTEGFGQAPGIDQADPIGHRQALHRRGGGVFAIAVADQ